MNQPLSPSERRREIVNLVMARKSISLEDLVAQLGVSRMTIHRDLDLLEERGLLRKERGGATAESSLLFESNFHYRLQNENAEKRALARAARALVEPGSVIMVDDSTTTLLLAEELETIEFVTVITNSLPVCELLRGRSNVQLILTGGSYNDTLQAFYGLICEQSLGKLRADWAFLSASSVIGLSLYHQDQEVVRMKRALMAAAERKALLLTHSKFKARALNHFGELSEFDRVFIDARLDEPTRQKLRQADIAFELV
ncbi:DeoR/GlpR transcriptional regulator [Rhodovastum atsumiense]|uniref:DeoR/GlpR transcriptional regulator n=1 Tax=Rhodovastum atsumiense TaxID=504468 RepID=A0A5M6IWC5_9PROT|nr:DeoR/GlpR family DNA-binding transcription regulator [Rhodovastum atsumiense]KAA5612633.1 DeoR/GlpR transcriptional regulator [Rhodovastum atsumiense]CAH2601262.1 DeoR/GlpR transcriptional regulator [Rhodovastum atsumiense]